MVFCKTNQIYLQLIILFFELLIQFGSDHICRIDNLGAMCTCVYARVCMYVSESESEQVSDQVSERMSDRVSE